MSSIQSEIEEIMKGHKHQEYDIAWKDIYILHLLTDATYINCLLLLILHKGCVHKTISFLRIVKSKL